MDIKSTINLEDFLARDIRNKPFEQRSAKNFKLLFETGKIYRFVSFLGAGNSKPLGIKGWIELISELKKLAGDSFKSEVEDEKDLPVLAEKLYNSFESQGKGDKFNEIVFQNMEPQCNSTTLTLIKLALLIRIHFTTNFDLSMYNACRFLNYMKIHHGKLSSEIGDYSIPDLPSYSQIAKEQDGQIIYLHGKKGGKYIFRLRDYDNFYPSKENNGSYSKCIEDCLKTFLQKASFLFVGFSFQDTRLKEMLFRVIADVRRDYLINLKFLNGSSPVDTEKLPKHFLIAQNNQDIYGAKSYQDFFNEFETNGIYPVIYTENQHIFLEHLFEKMIEKGNDGILF